MTVSRLLGRTLVLLAGLTTTAFAAQQSYDDFRERCRQLVSAVVVAEYNRALAEVRLLHGDVDLQNRPARRIAEELVHQGYAHPAPPFEFDWDPLQLDGYTFRSARWNTLPPPTAAFEDVPVQFVKLGLLDDDPRVRWSVLRHLGSRRSIAPVKLVLRGYLQESHPHLDEAFLRLLATPRYVSAACELTDVPTALRDKIRALVDRARTVPERGSALFLAVMFTDLRPPADIPIVVWQFDQDYPVPYFVRLFRRYPASLLEAFVVPFRDGYGDKHAHLLRVFMAFPENPRILDALLDALRRRREGHFAPLQRDIERAWAALTDIPYQGDDGPWLAWAATHRR